MGLFHVTPLSFLLSPQVFLRIRPAGGAPPCLERVHPLSVTMRSSILLFNASCRVSLEDSEYLLCTLYKMKSRCKVVV